MGDVILAVVGTVGILAVVAVAPNALKILRLFEKKRYYCPARVKGCLNGLIKNKFIIKDRRGNLSLSQKGELRLLKLQSSLSGTRKKWDKKWRIVIFDIWEKSKKKRDYLRLELRSFGFVKLQNSVWVTPYECEEFVSLLKTDLHLGNGVKYILASQIDDEQIYKKIFNL